MLSPETLCYRNSGSDKNKSGSDHEEVVSRWKTRSRGGLGQLHQCSGARCRVNLTLKPIKSNLAVGNRLLTIYIYIYTYIYILLYQLLLSVV